MQQTSWAMSSASAAPVMRQAVGATIMAAEQRFERGTVAQASVLDEIVVGIVDSGWRNWRVLQQLQRRRRCELDRMGANSIASLPADGL